MKYFIFLSLVVMSVSTFARPNGEPSNLICTYVQGTDGTWWNQVAFAFAVNDPNGDEFMEVDTATYDSTAPGHAMCTSYGVVKSGVFMITTYAFQGDFKIESGTCRIKGAGPYQIENQVEALPVAGTTVDMQVKMNNSPARYINYFMTDADQKVFLKDATLLKKKCLELLPGSLPYPTPPKN